MNILFRLIACVLFAGVSGFELYRIGSVDEARAAFRAELDRAAMAKDKRMLWHAYMSVAWFEDEVSEHRNAIEHSNKALEIAAELNDPFMIGRSLCWLGWAYAGLGMYDAALAFYTNAAELGAPNGEIVHPHVWGLATQEIGAIKFKMGQTAEAKKYLKQTYTYATEHEIDVGIAEGGAHLAEIALAEGDYSNAEKFSKKAVDAAERCNCSPYNLTRARVVRAKAELERSRFEPTRIAKARDMFNDLLADCEKLEHKRCLAETKLLISKTLPADRFDERYTLVMSAFETLANAESELRGVAEVEAGRLFLETENVRLAELYVKNGIKVDESMLRKTDKAAAALTLAEIEGRLGNEPEKAAQLAEAIKAAKKNVALPLILEAELKLVELLDEQGYDRASLEEIDGALRSANRLIERNPAKSPERRHFEKVRLELSERRLKLGLALQREAPPPAPELGAPQA